MRELDVDLPPFVRSGYDEGHWPDWMYNLIIATEPRHHNARFTVFRFLFNNGASPFHARQITMFMEERVMRRFSPSAQEDVTRMMLDAELPATSQNRHRFYSTQWYDMRTRTVMPPLTWGQYLDSVETGAFRGTPAFVYNRKHRRYERQY